MQEIAEQAARESAHISGFEPGSNDEQFNMHCNVLRHILGCKTGVLTHPLIINMDLCGHREHAEYRPGKRAAEAASMPDAKYVRRLLQCWWLMVQKEVLLIRAHSEDEQYAWVWKQHDFLICLEPFKSANGRTARVVYYMLLTALQLPIHIISAEKAPTYYEHKRNYRREKFAPLMREHGYIS